MTQPEIDSEKKMLSFEITQGLKPYLAPLLPGVEQSVTAPAPLLTFRNIAVAPRVVH